MPDDNDIVVTNYGPDFLALFKSIVGGFSGGSGWEGVLSALYTFWQVFSIIAFIISAIFIVGIVFSYIRFNQLSEIEMNQLLDAEKLWQQKHGGGDSGGEWSTILTHLESSNPNDWKLAIIEADIILERVLDDAGFAGNTIGEKLKSASPTNFTTLRDAWDAHTVRNKIAHQGADFVVTQRIAQDTLTKYRRVFDEFGAV